MPAPDANEVKRLILGLGMATAAEDEAALAALLADALPDVRGGVLVGVLKAWVGVVDQLMEQHGEADPRAATVALFREQAMDAAAH